MNSTYIIFDFDKSSDLSNWYIVDDRVMGGRSQGELSINENGHAVFEGEVSLKNNGGFSSLRFNLPSQTVNDYTSIVFRVRGKNQQFQFRIKSNASDRHSYITYFDATDEWRNIEIKLSDLYPSFRGRKLTLPNFRENVMNELGFLYGNKKEESFQLEIDWIMLK